MNIKIKKSIIILFSLLAMAAASCTKGLDAEPSSSMQGSAELSRVWTGDYSAGNLKYTSMKKVYNLNYNVSSITPAIDDNKVNPGDADDYLSNSSAMGYFGPLGPYGPLATLGPIGDNTWNVSYWISGYGDWTYWSDTYTNLGGPLSQYGPLGSTGPVANAQYYGTSDPGLSLFNTNDFARHSRALGLWAPLGPIGPLGALGPLGPLGPIGAHGYAANSNGEYISNGSAVRNITINYDGSNNRTYELFEKYTESFAKSMTNNDTSFMVMGTSSSYSDIDTYTFKSNSNQIVTVVLVPEKQLDDFDLTITKEDGTVIAVSDTGTWIDWVQIKVPANTVLKAKVKCYYSGHYLSSTYRLMVVGGGSELNQTEIAGNHIASW